MRRQRRFRRAVSRITFDRRSRELVVVDVGVATVVRAAANLDLLGGPTGTVILKLPTDRPLRWWVTSCGVVRTQPPSAEGPATAVPRRRCWQSYALLCLSTLREHTPLEGDPRRVAIVFVAVHQAAWSRITGTTLAVCHGPPALVELVHHMHPTLTQRLWAVLVAVAVRWPRRRRRPWGARRWRERGGWRGRRWQGWRRAWGHARRPIRRRRTRRQLWRGWRCGRRQRCAVPYSGQGDRCYLSDWDGETHRGRVLHFCLPSALLQLD